MQDESAQRILSVIRLQDMDGYSLMSRTGYDLKTIETALAKLLEKKLVAVRGARSGPQLGESWIYVPLSSKGRADEELS